MCCNSIYRLLKCMSVHRILGTVTICFIVKLTTQSLQPGAGCLSIKCPWLNFVWPIVSLVRITSVHLSYWLDDGYPCTVSFIYLNLLLLITLCHWRCHTLNVAILPSSSVYMNTGYMHNLHLMWLLALPIYLLSHCLKYLRVFEPNGMRLICVWTAWQ